MGFQRTWGVCREVPWSGVGVLHGKAARPQAYKPAPQAYCPDEQKA